MLREPWYLTQPVANVKRGTVQPTEARIHATRVSREIELTVSAVSIIQASFMSQSLNRYSYCGNNPLSYLDPSGFSWLSSAWKSIKHFVHKWGRVIAAIVVSVVSFGTLAPLPPSVATVAGSGLGAYLAFAAVAGWIERRRVPVGNG